MLRNPQKVSRIWAVIGLITLAVGCSDTVEVQDTDQNQRPVKVITIESNQTGTRNRYPAVIDAGERADLSFLMGGVIAEVLVTEAEDIEAGAAIARLDARDLQSSLDSVRATAANAEEEYQRAVRLAEQDAIATSVLEQRKTQRDVTQSQLENAEKALADTVIRAPFSGTVASVPVKSQQTISAGATVATVINVDRLTATVNVPASLVARVPTEERGPAVTVMFDVAPELEIKAEFKEADLVADSTSQTYAVTFEMAAPDNLNLLPGMNATVVLPVFNRETSAVSVPLAAILSDGDGQYVWIVETDSMTVSRRAIEVAPGIGENLIVTSGLSFGEQIVGAGGAYLAEGAAIVPWDAQ